MKLRIIAVTVLLLFINTVGQQNEFRGVWLTNVDSNVLSTDDNIAEAMDYLKSIGINIVFPVVYNKGYTLYPSEIMDSLFNAPVLPSSPFQNRDFLERVVIEAHRNGIEVIPWFEFGFSSSYSENGGHIVKKFPHWASKNNQGQLLVKNGFDWLSGINPEVQDYMLGLMLEVIDKYDIDGVQGDDRLPAMPQEGGYDSVTVSIYKSEHNGAEPPAQFSNAAWRQWRADKLTEYLGRVRDSVKSRNDYLILSVSPTPYYWGFREYLQDSKKWAQDKLLDNVVPQLYQYDIGSFDYALTQTWNDVGQYSPDEFVSGILMNIGAYVIDQNLLAQKLAASKTKGTAGVCFFFYEGLRKNSNQLGEYLKSNQFSQKALLPFRKGEVFRPEAEIVNEDSSIVVKTGEWEDYPQKGYRGKVYRTNNTSSYYSLEYYFDVADEAYYDVYSFRTPNTPWTANANYTLYSNDDSSTVTVNQSDLTKKGWHKLGTVYLDNGNQKVVKLDNTNLEEGKYLVSDAIMLLLNRKLSPNVVVSVNQDLVTQNEFPSDFNLYQNYPNPFNPSTTIEYTIPASELVSLRIYDILGREVTTLVDSQQEAGRYKVEWNASDISSGVYFYKLRTTNFQQIKKLLLVK